MNQLLEYAYKIKPKNDNYMKIMSEAEKETMRLHEEYCYKLTCEEKLTLHSVNLNRSYEMIFFKAESPQAAQQIFANDPAVKAGVVKAELQLDLPINR